MEQKLSSNTANVISCQIQQQQQNSSSPPQLTKPHLYKPCPQFQKTHHLSIGIIELNQKPALTTATLPLFSCGNFKSVQQASSNVQRITGRSESRPFSALYDIICKEKEIENMSNSQQLVHPEVSVQQQQQRPLQNNDTDEEDIRLLNRIPVDRITIKEPPYNHNDGTDDAILDSELKNENVNLSLIEEPTITNNLIDRPNVTITETDGDNSTDEVRMIGKPDSLNIVAGRR